MDKNYASLKKFCSDLGVDLFGVADIGEIKKDFALSQKTTDKINKAVCLGLRLSEGILGEISCAPTRLYFHHYKAVNYFLDQSALKVMNYIQKKGYSALPIPASQLLDFTSQKAHLSHKQIGVLAGIGWIGRNNLLVNKKLGSQFRLATVLTNFPLKADKPAQDNCGKCKACVAICPAGAIKEDPAEFDHIRCFEKLKEFQSKKLVDQYICGACVNACRGDK